MITLALKVACLLCPRRVTWWLVLGAMNSEPACPALLQFYCAFASERWAGLRLEGPDAPVTPFCGRVGRVLQPARRKVTWSQVWFGARVLVPYLCPCPEPSQGRRGFFQGDVNLFPRRRRCQPGRAQGYPACQALTWLLKPVCLQSPFPCCSLLEFPRKEARKRPGEQRPHPASTVACPSCWAFSLLLGLSSRGPQHFQQLSKVCVVLAKSRVTCSGSSSEGKHFGAACAGSRAPQSIPDSCPLQGSFMQTACCRPRVTWWATVTQCVLIRVWKLNGHPVFTVETRGHPWSVPFPFPLMQSISLSCWHYFLLVHFSPSLLLETMPSSLATILCHPACVEPPWLISLCNPFSIL